MILLPPTFLAISFDFESLLPILFFVLYGLSQFLGSKKKPQEMKDGEADAGDDALEEARERARRIREEIQRKIRERQGPSVGQGSGDWESPPVVVPPMERSILKETDAELNSALPKIDRARPTKEAYQNPLQSEMERRLEKQRLILAESQRRNEEARRQASRRQDAILAKAKLLKQKAALQQVRLIPGGDGVVLPNVFRDDLLEGLRDPVNVRRAILYREILGPPVGLR
ncbi:MAG: hypothetical protein RL648_702 [Verrucomicrobiota bacterium]